MLCPSCNNFRPANNAPCPSCNAPAPLVNDGWGGSNASFSGNAWGNQDQSGFASSWGGPAASGNDWKVPSGQLSFSQSFWQDPSGAVGQQVPFPSAAQSGFAQQPAANEGSLWAQVMAPSDMQSPGQSLVPYQAPPGPASQSLMVLPTGFPTLNPGGQAVNPLLPALPDADQEPPVYVAPMYTKPRPIIPRYRAISGLLSVIIVTILLCTGAGYYAQVTGKLVFLEKLWGNYTPPQIVSAQGNLQVPSIQATYAPGQNVITSTSIGTTVDANGLIPVPTNQFTVGQTIHVVCNPNSSKAGTITLKWYTDNNFYKASPPLAYDPKKPGTAIFDTVYASPAEGKVEFYWNDQLAVTLLFVVEPAA